MLVTLSSQGIRLDKTMLFHLLLIASWLLIIAAFLQSTFHQRLVLLGCVLVFLTNNSPLILS